MKVTKRMVQDANDEFTMLDDKVVNMMAAGASRVDEGELAKLQKERDIAKKTADEFANRYATESKEMEKTATSANEFDGETGKLKAFAQYVKNAINKVEQSTEIKKALAIDNATGGDNFIPDVISSTIISERKSYNKLRELEEILTSDGKYIYPLISYDSYDNSFVGDTEKAKEIQLKGGVVEFSGKKMKINFPVSETVVEKGDLDLATTIKKLATNAFTIKERDLALAAVPEAGTEISNFYDKTVVNIERVTGATMAEAIENARLELSEDDREFASLLWNEKDLKATVKALVAESDYYINKTAAEIFGVKEVILTDKATKPIIGDFENAKYHYDGPIKFEAEKDILTGVYNFVFTASIDHKILLSSAFRIAEIEVVTP